jgi:hypothetical protein
MPVLHDAPGNLTVMTAGSHVATKAPDGAMAVFAGGRFIFVDAPPAPGQAQAQAAPALYGTRGMDPAQAHGAGLDATTVWERMYDPDLAIYYFYNTATGETSIGRPSSACGPVGFAAPPTSGFLKTRRLSLRFQQSLGLDASDDDEDNNDDDDIDIDSYDHGGGAVHGGARLIPQPLSAVDSALEGEDELLMRQIEGGQWQDDGPGDAARAGSETSGRVCQELLRDMMYSDGVHTPRRCVGAETTLYGQYAGQVGARRKRAAALHFLGQPAPWVADSEVASAATAAAVVVAVNVDVVVVVVVVFVVVTGIEAQALLESQR